MRRYRDIGELCQAVRDTIRARFEPHENTEVQYIKYGEGGAVNVRFKKTEFRFYFTIVCGVIILKLSDPFEKEDHRRSRYAVGDDCERKAIGAVIKIFADDLKDWEVELDTGERWYGINHERSFLQFGDTLRKLFPSCRVYFDLGGMFLQFKQVQWLIHAEDVRGMFTYAEKSRGVVQGKLWVNRNLKSNYAYVTWMNEQLKQLGVNL